jgi:beta-phosphoglucomutase-like phosphatase (HAD superfamily)
MEIFFTLDNTLSTSPIEVIFFDADGVIQYSPEEWSSAFSRALAFDEALDAVLLAWDRIQQKSFVIETMLCIEPYLEIQQMIKAVRTRGVRCYVASNQQMQRAQFMSTQLGYASMFDGSCTLARLAQLNPQSFTLS